MRVTRKLEFDAAHRVMRHESKCSTLHGHRYVAEVTCESSELDQVGRVVDFGEVKRLVGAWVDATWDHSTLVNFEDERLVSLCEFEARETGKRHPYIFDGEPTAENISAELFAVASVLLNASGLQVVHVRVFETPNCWADCECIQEWVDMPRVRASVGAWTELSRS